MRLSRWLVALVVVAVLGVAGWQVFERYWYYLPGIMASLTDPVGPNRPVTWQPGPQVPTNGPRPPNVIVILADDLGWNDLTFNGGGVAGGAVPTRRIELDRRRRCHVHAGVCRQCHMRAVARGDHDRSLRDALWF